MSISNKSLLLEELIEIDDINEFCDDTSALKSFSKSIESMTRPLIDTSAIESLSKSIESMTRPLIDTSVIESLSKSIESMTRPLIDTSVIELLSKSIESMTRPLIDTSVIESLSKSIESMTRPLINTSVIESLSKSIESMINISVDISYLTEAIELYNEDLSQDDVNLDVNEINDIFLDDTLTIQEKLYNIWEKAKSKNIIIVLFVYHLIIAPILNPIKEAYDDFVYESLCNTVQSITINVSNKDKKQLNKYIKNDTTKELSNNSYTNKEYILNTYRFVSCDNLNVRANNTINSAVIYCLNRGSVVKIINKQKNWTKIEYKSQDETVIIKGWVLTRYINRFD